MLFFQWDAHQWKLILRAAELITINHKKIQKNATNYMYGLVNCSKQCNYRKSGRLALVKSKIFEQIESIYWILYWLFKEINV